MTLDRRSVLAGAMAAFSPGLAHASGPPPLAAPPGVTLAPLKTWSVAESALLLKLVGIGGVTPRYAVDGWRMLYPSRDGAGRRIMLSGLLVLPQGAPAPGVIAWLHGTTTDRMAVPSQLSVDGVAGAAVFASTGHATLCPDYLGLGASPLTHTYLVADDAARAVTDMLAAARRVPGFPAAAPGLMGFSQGGHAVLATQRAMEARGDRVRGAVAVAGPHHLRSLEFPAAVSGASPNHATYISYVSRGYAARYNRPLESILTPEAAALARRLYDTPHKPEEVRAALPAPRVQFQPAFLEAFDRGRRHWFLQALAANETAHFTPRGPVRLYYGRDDTDVLPLDAQQTAAGMKRRGADVEAIDVGPYAHDPSLVQAAGPALAWLDSLPG